MDYNLFGIQPSPLVSSDNKKLLLKDTEQIEKCNIALEDENRQFEEVKICGICCERPREVIFLACGHIYCCFKCSADLQTCPLDKKPIQTKHQFKMCDKYGVHSSHITKIENLNYFDLALSTQSLAKNTSKYKSPIEKYKELSLKNDKYKAFFKCITCNKALRDTFFLDCNHFICCKNCSDKHAVCPLCDNVITKRYQVYLA